MRLLVEAGCVDEQGRRVVGQEGGEWHGVPRRAGELRFWWASRAWSGGVSGCRFRRSFRQGGRAPASGNAGRVVVVFRSSG